MKIVVGLADSGIAPELMHRVVVATQFISVNGTFEQAEIRNDEMGHGTQLSRIIARYCPNAYFALAQIINTQGQSSVPLLAASIPWLAQHSQIINLSLGALTKSTQLEKACLRAQNRGCTLVASAPAVSTKQIFPASYKSVIAVTGDIRCAPGYFSRPPKRKQTALTSDFAACCYPSKADQIQGRGGSSYAAAHFSGWLARAMSVGLNEDQRRCLLSQTGADAPVNLLSTLN